MPGPHRAPVAAGVAAALVAAAGSLAVVAGGQPPVARASRVRWPVLDAHDLPGWAGAHLALLAWGGALALLVGWLAVLRAVQAGRLGWGGVAAYTLGAAVPLGVGPPVLSGDAYSYLAVGTLLRRGLDPYRVGPGALGPGVLASAVDPRWRATPTPYGPLALALDHLAAWVGRGSVVVGIGVLRAAAVAAALVAAGCLLRRAGRVGWLLVAGNPVVLCHVVGGAHIDAAVAAAVALALFAVPRGGPAAALAAAAGEVKAPGFAALAALGAHDLLRARRGRLRVLAVDAGAALAVVGLASLAVPDGFGWLRSLSAPGSVLTTLAPSTLLAHGAARVLGLGLHSVLGPTRLAGLALAALVGCWLLATGRRREPARTAGYLMAVALAGAPVLYPWYGVPVLVLLAPAAAAGARVRAALVVASAGAVLTTLPTLKASAPGWVPAAAAAVVLVAALVATGVTAGPGHPRNRPALRRVA